ncbi:proteasome subunit beta type-2-A-like [Neltuma alba]|uniref:proteasome subunit beta type-2-A-like n=1 Tax=Neltuma alba TaxID=207710 RepID=UPI0010A48422|nr:proteasome subunit beta type-2-A-like [Prosopis alba]
MEWDRDLRQKIMERECIFGLIGNGFAIVAADASTGYRFVDCNTSVDKITARDRSLLFDIRFTNYIQKKLAPSRSCNGTPLTTADATDFIRGELATDLRKVSHRVNMLLAGYDEETGPSLYHIDHTASLNKVEKGAFGNDSYFSLSIMDSHFRSGIRRLLGSIGWYWASSNWVIARSAVRFAERYIF